MSDKAVNRYYPDDVSLPGDTLLETIEERGISQAELARRMGRPHKTINEIIQGKASITPETAIQLEHVLGVPAHFWSNRQLLYDQHVARVQEAARLQGYREWVRRFPVATMVRHGWVERRERSAEQAAELLRFFGVASPSQWADISDRMAATFRQSRTYASELEHVSCWLRQGELLASRLSLGSYDREAFSDRLVSSIRSLTQEEPEVFQRELTAICAEVGVAVVFVPELPKARISGATRWLTPNHALVQLSLRYKTDDQLWFTFFHEAGHILWHGKRDIFLESPDDVGDGEQEAEADEFAANTLISPDTLNSFLAGLPADRYPSKAKIILFARDIGIAPGIVVGRLQHDRLPSDNPIPFSHYNDLKRHLKWAADVN
jgi:addiction module HigA family antidote